MPSASVTSATLVKTGDRPRRRSACRKGFMMVYTTEPPFGFAKFRARRSTTFRGDAGSLECYETRSCISGMRADGVGGRLRWHMERRSDGQGQEGGGNAGPRIHAGVGVPGWTGDGVGGGRGEEKGAAGEYSECEARWQSTYLHDGADR